MTPPNIDFAFRPTAYWDPDAPLEDGVVIASIVFDSVPASAIWVLAAPIADGRIGLAVSDDDGADYACEPQVVDRPLTLRELIDLIDGAECLDAPEVSDGLVLGFFELSANSDPDLVDVRSEHYPQLAAHYDHALRALIENGERP